MLSLLDLIAKTKIHIAHLHACTEKHNL